MAYKFSSVAILAVAILLIPAIILAASDTDIVYNETDLGGGLWQYDYTFHNTSNNNEYLYGVDLLFDQWAIVNGQPLPEGWGSTIWEGPHYTNYIVTFSTSQGYDIAAGDSLSVFSFNIDYQAGDISYNAYFDDYQGGIFSASGVTSVVPEPLSSMLFLSGGAVFALRRSLNRLI